MQYLKVVVFFSLTNFLSISHGNNNVTYYEDIINQQINESLNYKYPTDSSEYIPKLNGVKHFGTFDFIIVGAGSTGTVIANRLSEVKEWKILLLEAGSFGNDVTDIPNIALSTRLSPYNWGYKSIPQSTACLDLVNQQCLVIRGKGVGGSSIINALVYARGSRRDFDKWAERGNPGWSYNEVFPYFKKSENFVKTDPDVVVDSESHGSGGYLSVEYPIPRHPLANFFLAANKEKGYNIIDYNGNEHIGAAIAQLNINHGKRAHGGNAYIKPIQNRHNLHILTESFVTKVVISKRTKKAHGVTFTHHGQTYFAETMKEVILSAGVVGSAQLLMLSGIGPAKHLREVGIDLIEDLEVGSTLRDHPMFPLYFDSNFTKTHLPLSEYIKDYFKGIGSLATSEYISGIGFYQTKFEKEPNQPDLEILMLPIDGFSDTLGQQLGAAKEQSFQHLDPTRSFVTFIIGLHSKSVGTLRLKSNNPFDYPLIDVKSLSDPENRDINTLFEGIQLVLNLSNTQAFAKINTTVLKQDLPSCNDKPYMSKSYWFCVLRYFTSTVYHYMGTCPMGPNKIKGAVVNAQCQVYGIKDLRVADVSIFPFPLSGHPNAVCVMIGEKVSDLIKSRYL